ncbi:family 43 glycosylhydrolase [Mucilaginibacter sp. dw_454]|uniref:exo-alpha-sialidase n=1 Tax=Mucilaginibacter sp. dw_454 TaxID=2720079 RepID=UPI001BD59A4E|nr:family 43 glycosylhydrolase [Mucilaginibacter sp. dw_454]
MRKQRLLFVALFAFAVNVTYSQNTPSGWVKYGNDPVLPAKFGTIFDISVLKVPGGYLMYCSWRPKKSIAISESKDGFHWSDPQIVLSPDSTAGWEGDLNRPVVVKRADGYHMWYTGQISTGGRNGISKIGYATSNDGKHWKRMSAKPVLSPEVGWEKTAVMCPHVLWDKEAKVFKMWYSGGEQYEPDAIGYATSKDGLHWEKYTGNPVFANDPSHTWEQAKVTACQVIKENGQYYMFYIGFRDIDYAQIGMAKSKDGITNWVRYSGNPIIKPGNGWDASAVYKPFAIYDGKQWLLWYNGRHDGVEQIGAATHQGRDLGF